MSGQSIGAIIGGIIGVVLAPFTAGSSLAITSALITAGSLIGGLLDPPKGPNTTGPRLSDLKQQSATYGAFIPRVYGTMAVYGNVFWIENNSIKEVAVTETAGGKGGAPEASQTTYKYYGTFAVGLCEGPIVGIKRIWLSGKLWYNKASNDEGTLLVSADKETKFKFFNGSDTQMPAARMEADVGVGNCPAYRGLAYLLIHDLELSQYGNAIAGVQVKVEVITSGALVMPSTWKSVTPRNGLRGMSKRGGYLYVANNSQNKLETFDVSNSANPALKNSVSSAGGPIDCLVDKDLLFLACTTGTRTQVYSIKSAFPRHLSDVVTTGAFSRCLAVYGDYLLIGVVSGGVKIYDKTNPSNLVLVSSIVEPSMGCYYMAVYGNYLLCLFYSPGTLRVYDLSDIAAPAQVFTTSIAGFPSCVKVIGSMAYVANNNVIFVYDLSNIVSLTLVNTLPYLTNVFDIVGTRLFLSSSSGSAVFTILDVTDPLLPVVIASIVDDNDSFYCLASGGYVYVTSQSNLRIYFYHPKLEPSLVSLSSIVNFECLQSKLLAAPDVDTTQLTQQVRGYTVSSPGAIRNALEPLQGSWPFDVIQDGYKLKFINRGGASVATITHDKLDARAGGNAPGVQFTKSREMDSILPAKVTIKYADASRNYDLGEQYYERINTDAVNATALELPISLNAAEAQGKAQTLCYLYWLERYDISFTLPPEYANLQPADVITVVLADGTYSLRIKQINYTADNRLQIQAKFNLVPIYTPTAVGAEGLLPDDLLYPPGNTVVEYLDIPLLLEDNNKPGFPVALTGTLNTWDGGILLRSDDGGQTYQTLQGFTPPGATVGAATNTIAAHSGMVYDNASILNVSLISGGLASVTETQMLNGQNHFAYGVDGRWEIIAAMNCVLQGDGSYNLQDLLRGRYGTEQYTGTHVVGDSVVLLSSANTKFMPVSSSLIGAERLYKAVTSGATAEEVFEDAFTYKAVNLECLSPIYLNGNRHPTTNDWTLTWIRRDRVDEGWWPLLSAQMSESSESYTIEIYTDATFTVLKRTLTATTPTVTYTSANQITDFGTNQSTLRVKIYQNSALVGTGYPLTQSITR